MIFMELAVAAGQVVHVVAADAVILVAVAADVLTATPWVALMVWMVRAFVRIPMMAPVGLTAHVASVAFMVPIVLMVPGRNRRRETWEFRQELPRY